MDCLAFFLSLKLHLPGSCNHVSSSSLTCLAMRSKALVNKCLLHSTRWFQYCPPALFASCKAFVCLPAAISYGEHFYLVLIWARLLLCLVFVSGVSCISILCYPWEILLPLDRPMDRLCWWTSGLCNLSDDSSLALTQEVLAQTYSCFGSQDIVWLGFDFCLLVKGQFEWILLVYILYVCWMMLSVSTVGICHP